MKTNFWKVFPHELRTIVALVLSLGMGSTAHAETDPNMLSSDSFDTRIPGVNGTFKENLYSFSLIIRGTEPVTKDAFETFTLGAIWKVDFSIRMIDEYSKSELGTGLDSVLVSGTAQHIVPPHPGEAEGDVLQFSYVILPTANALLGPADSKITFNGEVKSGSNHLSLPHGSLHRDIYSGSVGGNNVNTHLVDWSVSLSGVHPVPEPEALSLASIGILCIIFMAARDKGIKQYFS